MIWHGCSQYVQTLPASGRYALRYLHLEFPRHFERPGNRPGAGP